MSSNISPNRKLLLATLPPNLVFVRHVSMATLTLFVWEILINISNDYTVLFEHRIRLPTIVYLISRLACLGLAVSCPLVQFGTTTFSNTMCRSVQISGVVLLSSTVAFTSLLFYLRVRAVFDENRWIVVVFGGLWLAVFGECLAFIIHVFTPGNAPRLVNKICVNVRFEVYVALNAVIPLVNDSLIFLAITWRLSRNSYAQPTLRHDLRTLVFGDHLPSFSKALLRDGQAYYMCIVIIQLVVVIMLFIYSLPGFTRTILAAPGVIFTNIMACRVFRNTMLYRKSRVADTSMQLHFFQEGSSGLPTFGDVASNSDDVVVTERVERMTV